MTATQIAADLAGALRALVESETVQARASYSVWNGVGLIWDDEVWFCADRAGFKLIKTARRALQHYDAVTSR